MDRPPRYGDVLRNPSSVFGNEYLVMFLHLDHDQTYIGTFMGVVISNTNPHALVNAIPGAVRRHFSFSSWERMDE
jgi:hypothetical protein